MIFIVRGTKNPKIIVDQNEYTINRKSKEKTSWRCTMYEKKGCKSRVITQGRTLTVKTPHNHDTTKMKMKDAIKQFVTIQYGY